MTYEEREAIRQIFREELRACLNLDPAPTPALPGSFEARKRDALEREKRNMERRRKA